MIAEIIPAIEFGMFSLLMLGYVCCGLRDRRKGKPVLPGSGGHCSSVKRKEMDFHLSIMVLLSSRLLSWVALRKPRKLLLTPVHRSCSLGAKLFLLSYNIYIIIYLLL